MSDNELDNLFKEAAADFESPQDATAWEQMSARLDRQAVKTSGFWNYRSVGLLIVAGLLVTSAIWYAALPGKELNVTAEDAENANTIQYHPLYAEDKTLHAAPSLKEEPVVVRNPVKNDKTNAENPRANRPHALTQRESVQAEHDQVVKQGPVLSQPVSDATENKDYPNQQESETVKDNLILNNTGQLFSNNEIAKADKLAAIKADTAANPVMPSDSLAHSEKATRDTDNKLKKRSGFSIKLAVSPDYSSINFSSSDKSGINYGVLAGYTFNSRWSVFTGVISSKKIYSSTDVENSYSTGGHTYPVEKLDGDCSILDIPVNVYYTFFPERSFTLKAGVGFSSYLMLRETYVYCVDYYGTDKYYEQSVKGKNNEWFKVLNLSVIAEKRLTNRWSAEVEPFVKVPLAGVGEGKVSLVSLGAFVNVRFNLFKNQ